MEPFEYKPGNTKPVEYSPKPAEPDASSIYTGPFQYKPDAKFNLENTSDLMTGGGENVLKGTLGAFLFSLGGAVIWVILYQFNIVAAIAGIVTMLLAEKGYEKFGHVMSGKAYVICVVITLLVLLLAMYVSLAFAIRSLYNEQYESGFRTYVPSIFEAMGEVPYYLSRYPEVKSAFFIDYFKGVGLAILYFVISIFSKRRSR